MSFVIGGTRLSSKGYNFFHALYFKDRVTLDSTFDVPAVSELLRAQLINPVDLNVGTVLTYNAKGRVLAYLFYVGGELRDKHLTKLCEWKDNAVLQRTLSNNSTPRVIEELREFTEFLWWLNQIRQGIEMELLDLTEVVSTLGLPLEMVQEKPLKLTLNGFTRQLTV